MNKQNNIVLMLEKTRPNLKNFIYLVLNKLTFKGLAEY